MRIGVRSNDRAAVDRFTKELAPLALNGPPVVTGLGSGRPRVEEIVAYWPALIPKREVKPEVTVSVPVNAKVTAVESAQIGKRDFNTKDGNVSFVLPLPNADVILLRN